MEEVEAILPTLPTYSLADQIGSCTCRYVPNSYLPDLTSHFQCAFPAVPVLHMLSSPSAS